MAIAGPSNPEQPIAKEVQKQPKRESSPRRISSFYQKAKEQVIGISIAFKKIQSGSIDVSGEREVIENGQGELDQLFAEYQPSIQPQLGVESSEPKEDEKPRHPNLPKIEDFPEKVRQEIKDTYEKAKTISDKISTFIKEGDTKQLTTELNNLLLNYEFPSPYRSSSQEFAAVVDGLAVFAEEANVRLANSQLGEFVERLKNTQEEIRQNEEENAEFPKSRDLLVHSIPFNFNEDEESADFAKGLLASVLEHGSLASRKYQIDHFGESRFTTSGDLVMGKDYVEVIENGQKKRLSPSEYNAWRIHNQGSSRKGIEQEAYQLYFGGTNGKNTRWHPYYRGLSFVFSKASLFSQAQIDWGMGTQLYDKSYDNTDPKSPGFSVDLTHEPVLLVIEEEAKDNFLKFIQESGVNSPLWQGQDVNSWIEKNVMFAPSGSYANDVDKYREFGRQVQNKFFQMHPDINIPPGKFMPSGSFGGLSGKNPLRVYQ